MKSNTKYLSMLAVFLLTVCPIIAGAAATDTGTDYMTDKTNSYVQDQSSKAMENLNDILCHVSAMDPAEMVNLGPYIALVDKNICSPNDGGGNSSSTSTGANYKPAIVNSTRADSAAPMIAKVWLEESNGPGNGKQSIFAYLSASQAPTASDPYGRFRMDFCGKQAGVCSSSGFINSTASGLAFFSSDTGNWGMGGTSITQTLKLQLNASSTTAGSGWLSRVTLPTGNGEPDADFLFAYNADYFLRSNSAGTGGVCFDRDPANAAESVWRYGLYNSTTGARIERNSGFPIEYTDATTSATMNGYVGYWGLNSPTTIANGATVNKVTYGSNSSPTKTAYTLMQTGGKLVKFTKGTKALDDLDKVKFQFWLQVPSLTLAGGGSPLTQGMGCSAYEVYWDKTAGNFKVTGQQDSTNNCNVSNFASALTMTIAEMKTAAPWGLNGWSQMLGGDFGINSVAMASLSGTTTVVTHTQDIVYPTAFPSGLVCIENCPTKTLIDASNANCALSPYDATTTNWNFSTGRTPISYTLDAATGNLVDATGTAVVSTVSQSSGTAGCQNNNGIQSGRLAIKADLDAAAAGRTQPFNFVTNQYLPVDFDQLTTYYQWQTGGNNWNQLSMLYNGSTPVVFDPPLNVDFVVPAGAKYGGYAGATFTLQYGGFGNLWGIPSTCIDVATNAACLPNNQTPSQQQRWTPQFSIPAGSSVTVSGGTTTYLVKALDKEVRLGKVATTLCTGAAPAGAGLALPASSSVTLPDNTSWSDPSSASSSTYVGVKPTFTTPPAPQVIHGVKMY